MAFVDITASDGETVHLNASSVIRVIDGAGGPPGSTRVDFGGEHLFTAMGIRDVAHLLTGAGAKLVEFAAPDMTPLYMRIAAITAVRAADPNLDPPGANSVVIVSGQRQSVHQTVQEVRQLLK